MSMLGRKNSSFQRYLLRTEKIRNLKWLPVIAEMFALAFFFRTTTCRQRKAPNPLKPNPLLVGQKGDGIWGVGRNKTELMLRSPIR
jgi:hypothetical protein